MQRGKIEDDQTRQIMEEHLREYVAEVATYTPERYPELQNLSSAFIYQFIPRPRESRAPEYVYVPLQINAAGQDTTPVPLLLAISEWNLAWEAGHLRYDHFEEALPQSLAWLEHYRDHNIYLIPRGFSHSYYAYTPLFHMLPKAVLKRFGLVPLKRGLWPYIQYDWAAEQLLPGDFDDKLASAFAYHVWPLLNSRSAIWAFGPSDPIRLLAHNLDFWLPYANLVVESRLRTFPRVDFDDDEQRRKLDEMRQEMPDDIEANRPLMGGYVWMGEDEAWEATREMVECADSRGNLRRIIDAVQSNRIEDDFSAAWSYEREDFERKLYRKRAKVKVTFVELNDTIPVHGPESEVHENLLWEGLLALLDTKEKRIVVCLRSGVTHAGEIGRLLGYAGHSPISKAMGRIRRKALKYLES